MTTDGHNIRAQNLQPERWISYHAGAAAPAQRSPGRRASDGGLALLAARSVLPAADMLGLSAASDIFGHAVLPDLAYAAVVVAMLAGSGLYRRRITGRVSGQVSRIVVAAAVALPVLLVWLSMAAALELALSVALAIIVLRDLAYRGLRAAHKRDLLAEPTLLVGAGDLGAKIADLLLRHPETGLRPVGFVDGRNAAHELPLPVVGAPAELPDLIFRYQIRRVIGCEPVGAAQSAFASDGDRDPVLTLRAGQRLPVDIWLVPQPTELGAAVPRASADEIWGIPLIPVRRPTLAGLALKRVVDVLAAAVLLVLFSPALLALSVAIWLSSGRPVIFRQARVTMDGRIAQIIKLRTLHEHADSDTRWSVPTEQLTRLGRWLRASHVDELPQLVNVLRGEMSLVGPRPERPYFVECFSTAIPGYAGRHRMRAGLTGWAQVHGLHGDTSIEERVRFDNYYIENWSLWLDLVILSRTLGLAMSARAAGGK